MLEKKYVTLKNGETYALFRKRQPGDKVLLVLIHGNFIELGLLTNRLSTAYQKKIFELIAPDLRGFGNSSYFKIHLIHWRRLATDIQVVIV